MLPEELKLPPYKCEAERVMIYTAPQPCPLPEYKKKKEKQGMEKKEPKAEQATVSVASASAPSLPTSPSDTAHGVEQSSHTGILQWLLRLFWQKEDSQYNKNYK